MRTTDEAAGPFYDLDGWHPAGSRVATVHGVRCHYVDLGPRDAPVIVLVHGIACSSWAWRFNLTSLATTHRVIAPCQRGFGWSARGPADFSVGGLARFIDGLLDVIGIGRVRAVVGNSLGGAVGLWLAQHRPDRIEQLVLVNPAALRDQRPWRLLRTQRAFLGPVYRAVIGPTMMRAGLLALAYRNLPVDSGYMAGFWTPLARRGSMAALLAVARALPDGLAALDGGLARVTHPTLVIWGQRDGVLPARAAHRLVRRLPRARLVLFERSGHCPHEEEPDRFNAALLQWLAGAGSQST